MKFRSLCLIGSPGQKSQENIERNSVPCIQMPVNLLMTEVTSLYLPCGRTTLVSVFHIRLFA